MQVEPEIKDIFISEMGRAQYIISTYGTAKIYKTKKKNGETVFIVEENKKKRYEFKDKYIIGIEYK